MHRFMSPHSQSDSPKPHDVMDSLFVMNIIIIDEHDRAHRRRHGSSVVIVDARRASGRGRMTCLMAGHGTGFSGFSPAWVH